MKAKKLIDFIEQEVDAWSKIEPKYARLEPTIDNVLNKYNPKVKKFDVQVYDDEGATKKYGRFMWDTSNKPKEGQPSVVMNGYKWNLKWLPKFSGEDDDMEITVDHSYSAHGRSMKIR